MLAAFLLARLEVEGHQALLVMEDADAGWRLDAAGHVYGSVDPRSWRRLSAAEAIGAYGVSQAPIQSIRKVDLMRSLVLDVDRDTSQSQQLRAIANVYRDHPDFRPGWFQHTSQEWRGRD